MPEAATATRELTLAEAVREALAEEMRRDPRVFICGEDIAEAGHPFKVLTGLVDEFGRIVRISGRRRYPHRNVAVDPLCNRFTRALFFEAQRYLGAQSG
jgi:hypothetical protein